MPYKLLEVCWRHHQGNLNKVNIIEKSLEQSRARYGVAHDLATKAKAGGSSFGGFNPGSMGDNFAQQGGSRQRYNMFRGWVHAAINTLATRAAKQPVYVGRLMKHSKKKPTGKKLWLPPSIRAMTAGKDVEIEQDHELVDSLENPNNMQRRVQFVYSFVANMCLTGWGFIVAGKSKDENKQERLDFFSVPPTWVKPDHTDGAFSKFIITNPNDPSASGDAKPLDRTQVAFAQFPNPADPLSATSLVQAQQQGIRIDDNIQTSQTYHFENGLFPSCLVTVGTNPHPSVPAGVRPRLTQAQRRTVYAAIERLHAGVTNYGRPAIIDGLIEKIESMNIGANEMGWDKSEGKAKSRILSGFGTHPFMLGEEVAASYAQAFVIERIFCARVNFFLEMLSAVMTDLCRKQLEQDDIVVWWPEAEASDPAMKFQVWNAARGRNDCSRNEFRQEMMGLAPDEDGFEAELDRLMLQPAMNVAMQVASGTITAEQGQALLEGAGLSPALAKKIAGDKREVETPPETEALGAVAQAVGKAVDYLSLPPATLAASVLEGL